MEEKEQPRVTQLLTRHQESLACKLYSFHFTGLLHSRYWLLIFTSLLPSPQSWSFSSWANSCPLVCVVITRDPFQLSMASPQNPWQYASQMTSSRCPSSQISKTVFSLYLGHSSNIGSNIQSPLTKFQHHAIKMYCARWTFFIHW